MMILLRSGETVLLIIFVGLNRLRKSSFEFSQFITLLLRLVKEICALTVGYLSSETRISGLLRRSKASLQTLWGSLFCHNAIRKSSLSSSGVSSDVTDSE
jgi:hypothetical protein